MTRLRVKDIVLIGAFAALYVCCVGVGTGVGAFFDHTGNMMYAPAFAAVFGGTVYMLLLQKVGKFGAISLLGLVMAGFFFLSGHFFVSALPGVIFGVLADLMAKQGSYQSKVWNVLSFVVFSFVNTGPILLMWLARQSYIDSLLARGKSMDYINRILLPIDGATIAWFILTVVVGGLVGALLGQYLVKKHFVKAGLNR